MLNSKFNNSFTSKTFVLALFIAFSVCFHAVLYASEISADKREKSFLAGIIAGGISGALSAPILKNVFNNGFGQVKNSIINSGSAFTNILALLGLTNPVSQSAYNNKILLTAAGGAFLGSLGGWLYVQRYNAWLSRAVILDWSQAEGYRKNPKPIKIDISAWPKEVSYRYLSEEISHLNDTWASIKPYSLDCMNRKEVRSSPMVQGGLDMIANSFLRKYRIKVELIDNSDFFINSEDSKLEATLEKSSIHSIKILAKAEDSSNTGEGSSSRQ